MSEKQDLFVTQKGRSWNIVNRNVLPEIDYDAVEGKTGLVLTEDIRDYVEEALSEYVCQIRIWEDKPLAAERRKVLKSVEEACELLESFLEWDTPGVLDEEEYDKMKLFLYEHVTPSVRCFIVDGEAGLPRLDVKERKIFEPGERGHIRFEGKNVADYLALCRSRIQQSNVPSFPGRPAKSAIRRCLISLRQCYSLAGGEKPGAQRLTDGSFSGLFLTFSSLLLNYTKKPLGLADTDPSFSESTLGALVVNKYRI